MEVDVVFKEIIRSLSVVEVYLRMCNKINLTDINNILENVYKEILNIVYDTNLVNLNTHYLFPAVDLGDDAKKIAIQVTSTRDISKIRHTIDEFKKNNLFEKYINLKVLIIGKKINHRCEIKEEFFDLKTDLIDHNDLSQLIYLLPLEKQESINKFLKKTIGDYGIVPVPDKESVEVDTIVKIIEQLSIDSDDVEIECDFIPDPTHKINERFSKYREFLVQTYLDFSSLYARRYNETIKFVNISTIKSKKIASYLKKESRKRLIDCNYDFYAAYEDIIDFILLKVKKIDIEFYDRGAIEYYVLKNIVDCNIFPNN